MLNRLVLAVPAIFCWGCSAVIPGWQLTQQGSAVHVADENIVRQCQYLGDVTGDGYARKDARNRAAARGATHVVFVSETENHALARAYDCTIVRIPLPAQPSQ
jgi:hypothetical protein